MNSIEQKFCNPCIPKTCHVPCAIGDELRNLPKTKCGEICPRIEEGIKNVLSSIPCKDASCLIGKKIIFSFKK